MLILTRKLGEAITIGDQIKVTILGIYGRQVRLGIDAPDKVVVHREEVYVRIQQEEASQKKEARRIRKKASSASQPGNEGHSNGEDIPEQPNAG